MVHFLLVLFYLENLYLSYHHMTLFLSLCFYHYPHQMLTLLDILVYFFNNVLSITLKDIVLLLSECLIQPIIWGSFMHKGLMTLSLYLMKYLTDLFVPYDSFFETNILSTLMSSIVNSFLFLWKLLFLIFFLSKIMLFPLILISGEKKNKTFSIIIWMSKEWSYIL